MNYLLDTCVISDFVKGELNTIKHIKRCNPNELCVSSVTVMELQYGLLLNSSRAKILKPIIEDLLSLINIVAFEIADAEHAALLRAKLKQNGTPIGSYDILIAGTAFRRKLIMVTSNTKEFERINELTLENWRLP